MSDDSVSELEQVISAGTAWLTKYGVVGPIMHNNIILNLYVAFPKARYIEYFLSKDTENKKVLVVLHVPMWSLLFTNKSRLIDNVIDFLREYLDNYEITVELKRYRKGVEKSNEIPKSADFLESAESTKPVNGS